MKKRTLLLGALIGSLLTILIFGSVALVLMNLSKKTSAEQSGGSPESGATSRIKVVYDSLAALTYGSDAAGSWGDWGAYWNRMRSAGEWTPSGDATAASDVRNTKTFYSNSRTQQTGSYPAPSSCPTQQYEDNNALATPANNCSLTWTIPNDGITGNDHQDPRTSLIWSYLLRNNAGTIEFSSSTSTVFSWDNSNANNIGRTAKQLCSDRGNGWRLPSEKEIQQAYIDGSQFNLNQPGSVVWAMTESSFARAWYVAMGMGYTERSPVTGTHVVICVRP